MAFKIRPLTMQEMTYNNTFQRACWSIPTILSVKAIVLVTLSALLSIGTHAQESVKEYDFTQFQGTYTEITGGTVLWSGNFYQQMSSAQAIPDFVMAGSLYTTMRVSTNGFITFGGAVASPSEHYPLSSSTGYARAVSCFGADLGSAASGTRDIRWEVVGDEIVVQWRGVRRKDEGGESFSFQMRLHTVTGTIRCIYGPILGGPTSSTSMQPQVGLRGPNNNFTFNVNNRRVGTGAATWATSLPGNASDNTLRFTSTSPAKFWTAGLTYRWAGCAELEGLSCDDGDPDTFFDTYDADCNCVGVPCDDTVIMEINSDTNADQTTWEIAEAGSGIVACSGGPYFPGFQMNITTNCCLPNACYTLSVFDSAGDGMVNGSNGGYQLRLASDNRRIIDSQRNGDFGSISSITGNPYSFCLPMGDTQPIYTSCDKYWWRTHDYVVCIPDADVSAVWVEGGSNSVQSADTGYETWLFNPNGGYSFRRFRSHNQADGFGNVGATRACHMRLNNWAVANHVPEFDLMNIRIRARVLGENKDWGPACRFVRDEMLALCPPTKLMDIPGNQFLSCNQFRQFGVSGQRIHARPVAQAAEYEWRFRIPAEGVEIRRTSTTYFLNLNWGAGIADPLLPGKTYDVEVRVFRDGAWCVDPLDPDSAWGDICLLTMLNMPAQGANQNMAMDDTPQGFQLWPNPNRGDQLWLSFAALGGIVEGETIVLDIHDLTGKRVVAREIPSQGDHVHTVIELNGTLANGVYLVSIMAGDKRHTERLIIAH
jgi:hypothetical protein